MPTRREFLRLSLVAPGLLSPAVGGVQQQRGAETTGVVVIGAGLAGLYAADLLRAAGREVLVLEASDRAGGRAFTYRSPLAEDLYGEAGPIRIAAGHRRVVQLAQRLGLTLVPFGPISGTSLSILRGKALRSSEPRDRNASGLELSAEERRLEDGAMLEHYVGDLAVGLGNPDAPLSSYAAWAPYDRLSWPEWLESRGASRDAVRLM